MENQSNYQLLKEIENLKGQVQRWKVLAQRCEKDVENLSKRIKELEPNEYADACPTWRKTN